MCCSQLVMRKRCCFGKTWWNTWARGLGRGRKTFSLFLHHFSHKTDMGMTLCTATFEQAFAQIRVYVGVSRFTLKTQGRPPPAALAKPTSVKQSATSSHPTPNAMQRMQHAMQECIPLWIHIVGTQLWSRLDPRWKAAFGPASTLHPNFQSQFVCLENVPGCVDTWIVLQPLAVDECVWCLLRGLPGQRRQYPRLASFWRPDYAAWGFDFRVLVMSSVHAATTNKLNKTWRKLLSIVRFSGLWWN